MKNRLIGLLVAGICLVAIVPNSASAKKPANLSGAQCAGLYLVIEGIDASGNAEFKNYGELVSSAITNSPIPAGAAAGLPTWDVLSAAMAGFGFPFESASQAVTTVAKCGLTSQVAALIKD